MGLGMCGGFVGGRPISTFDLDLEHVCCSEMDQRDIGDVGMSTNYLSMG